MKLLKKCETVKLFYDLYLYKLVINNSLSPIFRNKNLSHARQVLDPMQRDYEANKALEWKRVLKSSHVSVESFLDAKILLSVFSKADDYRLRIEYSQMCIYSNDKSWLYSIKNKLNPRNVIEFWEPDTQYLDIIKEKNTILIDRYLPFEYKITLGPKGNSQFANWARNNSDKIKAGQIFLSEIENDGYVDGMYFYVRDEKVLTLVKLILGYCIKRVDKIVHK